MNRLSELRNAKKLSQRQLAKILNVTQPMISGWEKGNYQIDNDMLKVLANLFDVSTDYILGRDKEENADKPKDLIEFLERETVALNGRLMTEKDKERMKAILEMLYFDSIEKNKRKK